MFTDPSMTLAEQMTGLLGIFLKTMAQEAYVRRIGVLATALWNRTRRLERRFLALHAMWKAGTLPKVRVRAVAPPPPRPSPAGAGEGACGKGGAVEGVDRGERGGRGEALSEGAALVARPASFLPWGLRWMPKMLPMSAASLASGVGTLVENHPQMRTFVAECPQVGRVLRPMLRMAGMQAPEYLRLPRRGRSSPRPSPQGGEGEERALPRKRRSPREVAAAAMEWSHRTGKPIDPRKIGAVAFGYVLHWPRDGNCPPPEIGYGGRMFPPLPKDYRRPGD